MKRSWWYLSFASGRFDQDGWLGAVIVQGLTPDDALLNAHLRGILPKSNDCHVAYMELGAQHMEHVPDTHLNRLISDVADLRDLDPQHKVGVVDEDGKIVAVEDENGNLTRTEEDS
jgi:hypothetical protein